MKARCGEGGEEAPGGSETPEAAERASQAETPSPAHLCRPPPSQRGGVGDFAGLKRRAGGREGAHRSRLRLALRMVTRG